MAAEAAAAGEADRLSQGFMKLEARVQQLEETLRIERDDKAKLQRELAIQQKVPAPDSHWGLRNLMLCLQLTRQADQRIGELQAQLRAHSGEQSDQHMNLSN